MSTFILSPADSAYPDTLRVSFPPPDPLYGEGDPAALTGLCLSVVGSRDMTPYGEAVLKLLLPPLVRAGVGIVSGLAYGIDAAAHKVALAEGGRCIAVLGGSLDKIYPASHGDLFRTVASSGCVITEHPPGTPPYKGAFPARNRIVAALSPVLLVVEAAEKSGTLSTVRHAQDMGKTVCVVPGDITRIQSMGTTRLLKEGATPVSSAEDILSLYQLEMPFLADSPLRPALTGSPARLYDCISKGKQTIEALLQETEWEISRLNATLSILEIDGYVTCRNRQWQTIS